QLPSKARHNLAYLYMTQGRAAEAEAQLRTILAERPDYLAGWRGLGELGLNQGQWDRVEEEAAQLRQDPRTALDGLVLQARGLLPQAAGRPARKRSPGPRRVGEEPAARAPRPVRAPQLLVQALLQGGCAPAATERALRALLALDPNNAEARRHLDTLQRRPQA